MKNYKIIILLFFAFIFLLSGSQVSSEDKKNSIIQLNQEFYANLLKSNALGRDKFLSNLDGMLVQGAGYVESVERIERYRRHFRISAIDSAALDLNIKLYIFADNEEYLTLLKKGDSFDFKGQFVVFTPLNSRRDSYILDIILEEGALSVK